MLHACLGRQQCQALHLCLPDTPASGSLAGIKALRSHGGGPQLVRVLLSDGTYSHQCLLASQPSAMVVGGALRQGAIVRLQHWVESMLKGKK